MRIPAIIGIVILVLLLAASIIAGEIAFRLERTVFSYRFTYDQLQVLLEPLDDPAIHARSVREAFRFVRRKLSIRVPRELEDHIFQAAATGFSASRIKQAAGFWLMTAEKVLQGKTTTMEFPLSLSPFKSAFLSSIQGEFPVAEQIEIGDALDEMPAVIDLAEELPKSLKSQLFAFGRSAGYYQTLLQYIIPGVLMAACFFHRRIGVGVLAVGAGLLLSGVPSIVVTALRADSIARDAAVTLVRGLPDFAAWIGVGIQASIAEIVRSGTLTAILITISGVVLFAFGLLLTVRKDGEGRFAGYSA